MKDCSNKGEEDGVKLGEDSSSKTMQIAEEMEEEETKKTWGISF